jgi:glycosyltransferase involved in cell wall biosynthesis
MVIFHIGGNRYDPLPNAHHTVKIWEALSCDADEYHVFARNRAFAFNTSRMGKIQLHLVPSVSNRMLEFMLTCWLALVFIRRQRPTHLVTQCPVMGGLVAALAATIWKIPLLVELHGTHYFQAIRPGWLGRIEHGLYKALSVFAFRAASRIRSLSDDMTSHLAALYGPEMAAKAVVVPTRVNTDVFQSTRSSYELDGALKIISVGGLVENKNHAALITALDGSDLDFQLSIVGEGPERAALTALIQLRNLGSRIKLLGSLSHQRLARELASHDVYVHYSKAEGLSRAILEAMACGCPVVTTRVGFIEGVLFDRGNSFIIAPPWDEHLCQILKELQGSATLRQSIGQAGLATIRQSFEAETVFQNYRNLIRSM